MIEPYTVISKKGNKDNLVLHNKEPAMNSTNAEEDNHSHSFIHTENTFDPESTKFLFPPFFTSNIYSHSILYLSNFQYIPTKI